MGAKKLKTVGTIATRPKILRCSCKHEFQDNHYGKGMRLFNKTSKLDIYRCTVCCNERGI